MIKINLLPPEYRKAERTPFVIFLPMILGLVCVLSAGAVAGYVRFSWLAETQAERVALEGTLRQKKPRLDYNAKLLQEEAEYKKQVETIKEIASGRVLMTRKLDELCALISEGDTGQHGGYHVWLQSLQVKPDKKKKKKRKKRGKKGKTPDPVASVNFKGYALADTSPLQDFNAFHRAIRNSEMFRQGYLGINDPDGKVNEFGDAMSPAKGWSFQLSLAMANPAELRAWYEKQNVQAEKEKRRGRKK